METHKDKLYTEIFFFSYIRLLKHIKYETVYSNTALENICAYISRIHTKTIEWLYRWNCTLRTVTENNLFFFLFFKILLIQHSRIYMWDKEKIGHVSLLLKLCQRLRYGEKEILVFSLLCRLIFIGQSYIMCIRRLKPTLV